MPDTLLESLQSLIVALDNVVGSCNQAVKAFEQARNGRGGTVDTAGRALSQCLAARERRTALLLERCAKPWDAYQASMRNVTSAVQAGTREVPYDAAQQALLQLTVCGRRELGPDRVDSTPADAADGGAGRAMLGVLQQHGKAVRHHQPART